MRRKRVGTSWPGWAAPEAGANRGGAFTLMEVLIVVAIVVLLLALLVPSFYGAKQLARAVACGANLHQISIGFSADKTQRRTLKYPVDLLWPAIPGKWMAEWELFRCPEDLNVSSGGGSLEFHSQAGYNVPFGAGPCCQIHRGPAGTWSWYPCPAVPAGATDYGFEDAGNPNSTASSTGDMDSDDCVVRIVDNEEKGAVVFGTAGYSNAIYSYGQVLLQLPSLWGPVNLEFPIPAGFTNYGYNSQMGVQGSGASLVALDYPRAVANRPGEDVAALLNKALRHMEQVNALYVDGSVQRKSFSQLNPAIEANRDQWGNEAKK